ncbi:Protein dennd6a [Boothiomyces macroporosus]|uniref:Protein dennd6a n=1 Tax=Boothiomyces macroporosus TaxID=261099 RepID=A0AAD5Y3Y9_9FUNG|nr:Protein dennd6a [Boothiomyces macroporosus]
MSNRPSVITRISLESMEVKASPELLDILSPNQDMKTSLSRLDLGNLWQWILCMCVVNFDLELGHALEQTYPPIPFSDAEKKTLCFSAFPDSNSTAHSGDSIFSFRMRNGKFSHNLYSKQKQTYEFAKQDQFEAANSSGLPIENDGYTYGYVFFRQVKDEQVRRGFFQKAIVLLTPHNWPGLFRDIIQKLGPAVMEELVALRNDESAKPPPPTSISSEVNFQSSSLDLPFFGKTTRVSFPPNDRFPQFYEQKTKYENIISYITTETTQLCNPGKFYENFAESLENLWTCWEIMTIGDPLIVMSDTPNTCSSIIESLIELIKPIPFGGDFRPYFTIQDPDFTTFVGKGRSPPPAIVLGLTNRMFTKVLENWPNIITTGLSKKVNHLEFAGLESLDINPTYVPSYYSVQVNTNSQQSCNFKHKSYFFKDKKLIKSLLEVGVNVKGIEAINNQIRQHFVELTQRFLQPLNRYFDSLIVGNPTYMDLTCLRSKPEIKPFRQDVFLKTFEQSVPTLPLASKRPIAEFYIAFLKSPNFASWLHYRTVDTYRTWRYHYLNTLCTYQITPWVKKHLSNGTLVECVDLLMRYKQELERYASFYIIDGTEIRYAHLPKEEPVKIESPVSPEKKHFQEVSYDPQGNDEEEVDISSLRNPKHIKSNTAPTPAPKPWGSTNTLSSSPKKNPQTPPTVHKNFKLNKICAKPLVQWGEFIPSPQQYGQLTFQLETLINLLPPELSLNARG